MNFIRQYIDVVIYKCKEFKLVNHSVININLPDETIYSHCGEVEVFVKFMHSIEGKHVSIKIHNVNILLCIKSILS